MAANKKDWAAKSRMLVTIQRCATMAICSTSTSAAISVTILLPNSGSCKVCIAISEEERGHQAERRQGECHGEQVGNAEEAHLGVGGLHQNDGDGQHQQFQQEVRQADQQSAQRPRRPQAEGQKLSLIHISEHTRLGMSSY